MQTSSDSSIWRSLAVAFGDGLAFGVGVKLSQNAARQRMAKGLTEGGELGDRLAKVEETVRRIERPGAGGGPGMDQKVLEVIVAALEARLKEQSGLTERRLADLDAKITFGLKTLDEQDEATARQVHENLEAMKDELVGLNREFGESVGRVVAEQVGLQVGARTAELEGLVDRRLAAAVDGFVQQRFAGLSGARFSALERQVAEGMARRDAETAELRQRLEKTAGEVESRVAPLERQLRESTAEKDREIAQLRRKLAEADEQLVELVAGIGQVCRRAVERPGREATEDPSGGGKAETAGETKPGGEEAAPGASPDADLPGFAQPQKSGGLWRVPLVSSMVVAATGGLLAAHYL